MLSEKLFTKDKEIFFIKEIRKYMASYKIFLWWNIISYNPRTKIGKKRLELEYESLL